MALVLNVPYSEKDEAWVYEDEDIHIASHVTPIDKNILNYLKNEYGYYKDYSRTLQES